MRRPGGIFHSTSPGNTESLKEKGGRKSQLAVILSADFPEETCGTPAEGQRHPVLGKGLTSGERKKGIKARKNEISNSRCHSGVGYSEWLQYMRKREMHDWSGKSSAGSAKASALLRGAEPTTRCA